MDHNYAYAAISFLVGVLAGVQGVAAKYRGDTVKSSLTLPGLFYLFTRGAQPAALFAIAYYNHWMQTWLFVMALAFGVGAEVFLRSQFLVKQTTGPNGAIDDLLRGPLDLLRWYQDQCLTYVDTARAQKRQDFISRNLPKEDFLTLYARVLTNFDAYKNQIPDLKQKIEDLKTDYEKTDKSQPANNRYRLKLGYTSSTHCYGERFSYTLQARTIEL